MKLLLCPKCFDIFKLDYEKRSCKCGEVTGRYLNEIDAITNGKGISLAIGSGSIANAKLNLNGWEIRKIDVTTLMKIQ